MAPQYVMVLTVCLGVNCHGPRAVGMFETRPYCTRWVEMFQLSMKGEAMFALCMTEAEFRRVHPGLQVERET